MTDRLTEIFEAQRVLGNRFLEIEKINGIARASDQLKALDLNDFYSQHRIRGYAWRIVEECCEATSAATPEDRNKEIADILHFLVEFSILAGFDPTMLAKEGKDCYLKYLFRYPTRNRYSWLTAWDKFIVWTGMTINQLKSRPWKTELKPLDLGNFYVGVKAMWFRFADLCSQCDIDDNKLYDLYFSKNKENNERIENGV